MVYPLTPSHCHAIRNKRAGRLLQNQIVYGIFLPSLMVVNVAKTCVSQPVASLLPIPVFAAVQIGVGLMVSGSAMRVLRIDPDTEQGRETRVCA